MKNRWVQLAGSVVGMVMIANLQYAWTLFVQPIQGAQGWTLLDIQGAFSLFLICETWIMPVEGWLIDSMGPRIFLTIAGAALELGERLGVAMPSTSAVYACAKLLAERRGERR